ncbi:MAG: DUF4143 domain-containing protein, partial [Chloroflexi bacterium]|nr:DUF4143 domain-containing protein [Chloroflexota bacterium]
DEALIALRGYLEETRRVDLVRVDGIARDPENVARVLRSLARNIATGASARAIAADVGGAEGPIDTDHPARRADAAFVDPSLAVVALGTRPDRLLRDVETLGLLFESLIVRDLRIHAQAMDASVFHYRDSTDLEADVIVERRDGTWAAFEVKLGQAAVDGAAATLRRVAARVDQEKHGKPAVFGVLTGWGYGYQRPDGVAVIPIGALAP